jgi:hypothetical protein
VLKEFPSRNKHSFFEKFFVVDLARAMGQAGGPYNSTALNSARVVDPVDQAKTFSLAEIEKDGKLSARMLT